MSDIAALVADNIHIWTGAIQRKSGAGRGGGKRNSLYGIERLRALILDLAVRGKLVPQDPTDEPASELLKRIKNEKNLLVANGKAKPGKPLAVLTRWPFEIPTSWSWSQLGYVTNYGQTEKADPGSVSPETWVLELEDVEKGTSHLLERVRCADKPFQSQKNAFQVGDVIYGKLRPYLDKVIIADEPGVCTTEMVPMRGYAGLRSDYIRLFLKTPFFITLATDAAHGMNLPRLATERAREAPFALPPLAEQQRIVAKVDELMALCDALERESAGAMAAHQALVDVLLASLVNSADAADLARQWARLESHFDNLFTTDASIDALKHTILDLAVRGKLVQQDAGDEVAKLPSFRQVSASSDWDEKVFQRGKDLVKVPSGWKIAPLAQVSSHIIDCPHTTPKWTETGEICVRTNQIKPRWLDLSKPNYVSVATYKERIERLQPFEGDILYIREGGILGVGCRIPADVKLCLGQRSMLIRCHQAISSYYLEIAINSPFIVEQAVYWTTGGAAPRVNMSTVRGYPIPIPPLPEQRRIVAKVDALMVLCDALKARLADASQTQRHLADAITERAAA